VPRYYFHFTDGTHWFTDSKGHELAGLHAARVHALQDVRALTAALCERHVQDLSAWTMAVVDSSGTLPCYEYCTPAPSRRWRTRWSTSDWTVELGALAGPA